VRKKAQKAKYMDRIAPFPTVVLKEISASIALHCPAANA
jgi:hypothetical protein